MNKHVITQLKSNYMAIYLYPPSSRDIGYTIQKRRTVCFQRLKFVFASVFPFCCFCRSFYSFCVGAQFCCVKLGVLDEMFKVMHHGASHDCNQF